MKEKPKTDNQERWRQFSRVLVLISITILSIGNIIGTNSKFENIFLVIQFVIWFIDVIPELVLEILKYRCAYSAYTTIIELYSLYQKDQEQFKRNFNGDFILKYSPIILDNDYISKKKKETIRKILSILSEFE